MCSTVRTFILADRMRVIEAFACNLFVSETF